jgi:hypothetical protein
MPPTGFELTIRASERPQTHALDRATAGIGITESLNIVSPVTAVPGLRRLVAVYSPWRLRFDPRSVHVIFVVDKVAQ